MAADAPPARAANIDCPRTEWPESPRVVVLPPQPSLVVVDALLRPWTGSASVRSDDRQVKVLCSLTSSLVSAPPLFLLSVLTALFFLLPYFSSALCSHLSLSSSPSHLLASHSIPPCRATPRCTWPRRPRPPSRSGWPTASRPRRWSGGCSSPGAAAGSVQPPRRRCSSAVSRTPHLAPVGVSIGERRWCR